MHLVVIGHDSDDLGHLESVSNEGFLRRRSGLAELADRQRARFGEK
jgi:hypothetical protein